MEIIERAFAKIGARVKFAPTKVERNWRGELTPEFSLDVRADSRGEFFLVRRVLPVSTEIVVLDTQPKIRHLLLLSRKGAEKHRYLLGHDERHWFVAGIPEARPVSRVRDAMQALKPELVADSESFIRGKERDRRVNRARTRQGEWFFLPAPQVVVPALLILRNEPIARSNGGKPHMCEELFRRGGETVYVSGASREGLSEEAYRNLSDQERRRHNWRVMRRNPEVYVRGRVRHSDHQTVTLNGWHRVLSNTEDQSYAMRNIVFLD